MWGRCTLEAVKSKTEVESALWVTSSDRRISVCETFDILQTNNEVTGSQHIKFLTDSTYTPEKGGTFSFSLHVA